MTLFEGFFRIIPLLLLTEIANIRSQTTPIVNMSLSSLLLSFRWISAKFSSHSGPHQISEAESQNPIPSVSRPRFDDLPLRQGDPKGSAWGLWGDDDERGTLNLISNEVVRAASKESIHGIAINLKYSKLLYNIQGSVD